MIYYMKLNDRPFNMMKRKLKTFELRLFDEKRSQIEVGDFIEFTNSKDVKLNILVEVINLYRFNNFLELYNNIPLDRSGYLGSEMDDASYLDMYNYYTKEQELKYGVLAIEVKLIK